MPDDPLSASSLDFELDGVEGGLQEMDGAVVGVDHQLAVGPRGIFMSADEERQGELFEDVIVGGLEIVIGKRAENGAWLGDVLDEEFVGEVREQRVHDGSCCYLLFQARKRGTMRSMTEGPISRCRSLRSRPFGFFLFRSHAVG